MTNPLSLCILRLSSIGDVCHTLAVVQAIQRQYPTAEIYWIIGKTEAGLIAGIPNVTLIPYDKKTGWKGIFTLWKILRHKRFDFLLNMQTALRASFLSLGIKANIKIGFNRDRAREMQWLFTNKAVEQTASPHVLDGQMMFAKAIGVQDLTPQWNLPICQADLDHTRSYLDPNRKNILIAPCSSKKEKDWSPENYIEVAQQAINQHINVIICGSPNPYEMETADKIQQTVPKCLNLAGKTNLKQLAGLIQQVDLVISSDSGPAHIATTQHTPVIGLYAVHNPRRTGPYQDLANVISVYDEAIMENYGKPWQQLPWATKAKGQHLMEKIDAETVAKKMLELLSIKA